MKERPILFSGEMVRAILDGRKTQTRRIAEIPFQIPEGDWYPDLYRGHQPHTQWTFWELHDGHDTGRSCLPYFTCPYGIPGDRLWVRESLRADTNAYHCHYVADGAPLLRDGHPHRWGWQRASLPSIHMPRWASRITLEITDVRVERLHDINDEDAWAEGVTPAADSLTRYQGEGRELFLDLWRRINGEASLDANPWVWAISFKQVTA